MIIIILPRTGIANKLLLWAKWKIVANKYNIDVLALNWNHPLKIGVYIRKERSKRIYRGFFKINYVLILKAFLSLLNARRIQILNNPKQLSPSDKYSLIFSTKLNYEFDYFENLRGHESQILQEFIQLLKPKYFQLLEKQKGQKISVHIRLGDFSTNNNSNSFKTNQRLPITYYSGIINKLLQLHPNYGIKIFSDGYPEELKEILDISGRISMSDNKKDLEDFLELIQSDIIVITPQSTYSCLAAYLSKAIIISGNNANKIRKNNEPFEGTILEYEKYEKNNRNKLLSRR